MAFAGHMQIELIQPKDNHPSVYKEIGRPPRLRLSPRRHRGRGCRSGMRRVRASQLPGRFPGARAERRSGVLHGRWPRQRAGLRRADPRHAGHGRDVHALLARVGRVERRESDPAVRLMATETRGEHAARAAHPSLVLLAASIESFLSRPASGGVPLFPVAGSKTGPASSALS